jgi:hypothetical protein
MADEILVNVADGIATVTLNRPAQRNAMNSTLLTGLRLVFDALDDRLDVRVVVVRGAGPAFCAGMDLKEMEAQECGRVFEDFWDALNAATNKWDVVEGLKFEEVVLGVWKEKESLGHGIESWVARKMSEAPAVDSYGRWREKVLNWKEAGWGRSRHAWRTCWRGLVRRPLGHTAQTTARKPTRS